MAYARITMTEATLEGRKKHVEDNEYVKDSFYYEGAVSFWKID